MNISLKPAANVKGGEWVMALDANRFGRVMERVSEAEVQVEWTLANNRRISPLREIEPIDNIRVVGKGTA